MHDPAKLGAPGDVLGSEELIATPWLHLRRDRLRLAADGIVVDRPVLGFPDWVDAIVLTPEAEIILVEQFRHAVRETRLEFPAGNIEPSETPLAAVRRELLEETGFASDDWRSLGSAPVFPAWQGNRIHSFLALDARQVAAQSLDQGEAIRLRRLPFTEFLEKVADGAIALPSLQVAGLWLLRLRLMRSRDPRMVALRTRVAP